MSASDINAVIDQLSHTSVEGASTLSFAGRGLKLDSESDGKSTSHSSSSSSSSSVSSERRSTDLYVQFIVTKYI